jgi:predicted metal-dependent hydrolase
MLDEPVPPYPDAYLAGLRQLNERQFFDAHETLEALWVTLPKTAGPKRFYQALIQIATAYHHLTVSLKWNGARKLFLRAHGKLDGYPDRYGGLDLAELRSRLGPLAEAVDRVESGELQADHVSLRMELWPDGAPPGAG